jgi:AraC-like DNA-binding protein
MNKDLYGNKFSLPEEVVSYLQQCHDAAGGADESVEGYKRNKELRDSREVTYQQLKRMKNWFDKFEGDENDLSYILNNYFNLRFTDFVNQYRIKHVITIFNDSYLDNFTIESAAFEAGFTSKSGFYKSFKKLYKMTPTEYFQNTKPSNLTKE